MHSVNVTPFCLYNSKRRHVGGIKILRCGRVTSYTYVYACELLCFELHVPVEMLDLWNYNYQMFAF